MPGGDEDTYSRCVNERQLVEIKQDPDGMTYLGLSQCILQARAAGQVELTRDSNDICMAILRRADYE